MLAYAAHRRMPVGRRSSPNAMLVIIAAHVAAVAALMSAKMELEPPAFGPPTIVDFIPVDKPPPPSDVQPERPAGPLPSTLDQPRPLVTVPSNDVLDARPVPVPDFDQIVGPSLDPPRADPVPPSPPVKMAARLLTPAAELKPEYPRAKLASGEEAVLRLKLAIDERGRVIDVLPVGPADPAFLQAARRHLLARWRYKPATEGGRAVPSSTVITLRFQLEG